MAARSLEGVAILEYFAGFQSDPDDTRRQYALRLVPCVSAFVARCSRPMGVINYDFL